MNPARLTRRAFYRDGLELALWDSGGEGLPLVFQHGLCGDVRQTAEAVPDAPGLRLITLECRGHGASAAGNAFGVALFADDVAAMIASEVGQPVVLGGISMGVAIASRLAVRRPEILRGLILARPAWVTAAAPDNMTPNAEVGALLAAHPPQEARRLFEAGATAQRLAQTAPDNLASLRSFFDRAPLTVTARLLTGISYDGPGVTEADLTALAMPVLVLGTQEDAIHPLSHAVKLAGLIPGARLIELTPKARDRARYVADFHAAISGFIERF